MASFAIVSLFKDSGSHAMYCGDYRLLVSSLANACNHSWEQVVGWSLTDAREKAFVLIRAQPVAALTHRRRALEAVAIDFFEHAVCET